MISLTDQCIESYKLEAILTFELVIVLVLRNICGFLEEIVRKSKIQTCRQSLMVVK